MYERRIRLYETLNKTSNLTAFHFLLQWLAQYQSNNSHFCTDHGRVSLGTLAPSGEYDWTCAFMIELVVPSAHLSPQPKRQINWFSHFCTAHGKVSLGTLAPPSKYDWSCASLGSPEFTTQTANWSVQPFLHSLQQKSLYILQQVSFLPKLPLPTGGSGAPSNTIPWAHPSPQPKWHVDRFSLFAQITVQCPYTLQWDAPSPKIASSHQGIWTI